MSGNGGQIPALADLQAWHEQARREIAECRAEILECRARASEAWRRMLELQRVAGALAGSLSLPAELPCGTDVLHFILREAGRPLAWAEINRRLEELRAQGYQNLIKLQTLRQDISRPDRNRGRYELVGRGLVGLSEWKLREDALTFDPGDEALPPEPAGAAS
jgi:hypothetical protein